MGKQRKPPKASASRRVASGLVSGAVKAADILRTVKKTVSAKVTGLTKPVGRARKEQVNRQIGIDVERRPVGETFKKGRSTPRLAPEVEMARKRRGKR